MRGISILNMPSLLQRSSLQSKTDHSNLHNCVSKALMSFKELKSYHLNQILGLRVYRTIIFIITAFFSKALMSFKKLEGYHIYQLRRLRAYRTIIFSSYIFISIKRFLSRSKCGHLLPHLFTAWPISLPLVFLKI